MTPRPCCLTSAFLPLAWPDRGHSRPPAGPRSQLLQMGVKWDQGGGTSVGCSLCRAQDSRQAAQNEGGNAQSCGNEAGAGGGWEEEPTERQRAGAGAATGRGLTPCGGSPRGPGQAQERSLLVHLSTAEASEGVRGGAPCGNGEGRPWNCTGVGSLGGWGGVDVRWGPWAKGGGVECLPISSVAPFQGPRFPLLL